MFGGEDLEDVDIGEEDGEEEEEMEMGSESE